MTKYDYSQKCTFKNFITSCKTALKLERYTNADLEISLYAWLHVKTVPWKFRNLNLRILELITFKV